MSKTCGCPCPVNRIEREGEEAHTCTGKEDAQLSRVERKLLWLQMKLEELIPGYTDGVTQKISRGTDHLPIGQSGTEENVRRSSGEGATGRALTCESVGEFQNHALKYGHTPACTRKVKLKRGKFHTRVSRLAERGGLRRLARQGGSSNPKGGAGQEEGRKIKTSQLPQRTRATADQTQIGSRYIRKKV
jgi:hypothetical protein